MDNKISNSPLDDNNSNKDKKIKSIKERRSLIPINISLVKNIFTLPQQNDKNIIYINDIETLNDSSLTNNLVQTSIRYNQNDSLSLSNSNNSSKTKPKNIRIKNIDQNNYIKNELIAKEKENILLKKEIFKLREDINLFQNKFSKSKQNEQNLEKNLIEIKKDFQMKENIVMKLIEKLKNELKEKDYILNSLQEKIILKNKYIERLRIQLNKKESEINKLNRKLKKNIDINYSRLYINKERNFSKNSKSKQRASSGRETTNKKINISISNSKEKTINENKKSNNILHLQHYNLNTQIENIKNFNYIESSNSQKVIGLKKRSKLQSPIILETKYKNSNNKETKNKFKNYSYSDKIREYSQKQCDKSISDNNLKNLKHIFLLQGKNNDDVFLKRYSNGNNNKSKYLKQSIKSYGCDTTSSFLSPDSEINRKNYKIDIPKLKTRKSNNSFSKLISNNYSNSNQNLEHKIHLIKKKFNDEMEQNLRKINGKMIISNKLNNNNNIFIPRHNTERKINFLYANSVNESNSILSNNYTVNTMNLYENIPSTKSNNISKQIY